MNWNIVIPSLDGLEKKTRDELIACLWQMKRIIEALYERLEQGGS